MLLRRPRFLRTGSSVACACVPLLVPFVGADLDFTEWMVPLHQAYLGLRSTNLVSEVGQSDGAYLNLAIESAMSQLIALAQGSLVSLSMERSHHDHEDTRLHEHAEAAEEATREVRVE
ncbi:hypothetical protein GUJ93_ZPchr0010g8419 [Zizania palustris]|uniref:Uncharacterized protein n=1 Tax=Zizania palustris TaxID=103762 RepID=A0A8J6BJX6_ZIZPA|nr:hypothetical protein GUJ93_ZPchr0010g8419 [Zizania palustris]